MKTMIDKSIDKTLRSVETYFNYANIFATVS